MGSCIALKKLSEELVPPSKMTILLVAESAVVPSQAYRVVELQRSDVA